MSTRIYNDIMGLKNGIKQAVEMMTVEEFVPELKKKNIIVDACPYHPFVAFCTTQVLTLWTGSLDKKHKNKNVFPLKNDTIDEIRSRLSWAADTDMPCIIVLQAGMYYQRDVIALLKALYVYAYNMEIRIITVKASEVPVRLMPQMTQNDGEILTILGCGMGQLPHFSAIKEARDTYLICCSLDNTTYEQPDVLFALIKSHYQGWNEGNMKVHCIRTENAAIRPGLSIRLLNLLPEAYHLKIPDEHRAPNLTIKQGSSRTGELESLALYTAVKDGCYDLSEMEIEDLVKLLIKDNMIIVWLHNIQYKMRKFINFLVTAFNTVVTQMIRKINEILHSWV